MLVLNAAQIKAWDKYTIAHEPITAELLLERAALKCATCIFESLAPLRRVLVLCGSGGNGADGLAITRLLNSRSVDALAIHFDKDSHPAALWNKKLDDLISLFPNAFLRFDSGLADTKTIFSRLLADNKDALVIDALFGTSLRLPLPETIEHVILQLNDWRKQTKSVHRERLISIDLPSGLPADFGPPPQTPVVTADMTLTFQCLKESLLLADTGKLAGQVKPLDIELDDKYLLDTQSSNSFIDLKTCRSIFQVRSAFSHKGTFGHSLIVAGSREKAGAAVLCAKGCLRGGSGLVSALIPEDIRTILLSRLPEAMALFTSSEKHLSLNESVELDLKNLGYNALAIGPGIGVHAETKQAVLYLLKSTAVPTVIDADALNILSEINWRALIRTNHILTPHLKEFDRLAGDSASDFERLNKQRIISTETGATIVLKGYRTSVSLADGTVWFNTTGNPGMATAGSGDTLTGVITALLAQKYSCRDASRLGVFVHGLAGDLAARACGETSLIAEDISQHLGKAFKQLEAPQQNIN